MDRGLFSPEKEELTGGTLWQLCKLTHQEALVLFLLLNICFGFIGLYYSYPGCFKIITYLEEHISYSSKLVTQSILDIHQFILSSDLRIRHPN